MTDYVYRVVDDTDDVHWVTDAGEITDMFGTVSEVTRYRLVDPTDFTDEVNGGFLRGDDYS